MPSGHAFALPRNGDGLAALVERLQPLAPALIVLEATGGFEAVVAAALAGAGLPLAVINPRQIRDFARAVARLAKTDALDAAIIACFAERIRPPVRPWPEADRTALAELVARRRQIIAMIVAESNRRRHATAVALVRRIDRHPAGLAGVAPMNQDSGQRRGRRALRGGRPRVRSALSMAARVGSRRNPVIQALDQRLLARGAAKTAALAACRRKVLVMLNAILRTRQPWRDADTPASI